jgi:transposase InsO family protein
MWNDWRSALLLVKPETVIAWHRKNHAKDLVSADFFVVPTIAFQLLFVFVILDQARRRPIHFAVTANPTAEWAARQLLEAFPWDNAPRTLLRDRDRMCGEKFCETAKSMGIREVLAAPRSPWQNPFAERLVGSIRRECARRTCPQKPSFCSEDLLSTLAEKEGLNVSGPRSLRKLG